MEEADEQGSNPSVTPENYAGVEVYGLERGLRAPFDTICLNLNRPPALARAMYGRIRFDGNAPVKTCL